VPSDPIIRDLTPTDDVEALVEIAMAAWAPLFEYRREKMGEAIYSAVYPDWRAAKAGQIRSACGPGGGAGVCVAEIDGRIVGFVTYFVDASAHLGRIGNNAVHPDFQGRGIGTSLYARVIEKLRAAGARVVKVVTGLDPTHAKARRAYAKAGFNVSIPTAIEYYRQL